MRRTEYIETLKGCEVSSTHFEGVVGIDESGTVRGFHMKPKKATTKELKILFSELCEQEGV